MLYSSRRRTPRPAASSCVTNVLAITALLALLGTPCAQAHVNSGANCASCHSTTRSGMTLTGSLSVTNLGRGSLKLYRVAPGQSAAIGISVTDGHNQYGLALAGLADAGLKDSAHHLAYTADATWTRRTGYYSVGPSSANRAWNFNLAVLPATPTDVYLLTLQMAGTGGGKWAQKESFYLQVLRPTPPAPAISDPSFDGTQFSCEVTTVTGFTYFLEAQSVPTSATWRPAAQINGDGTVHRLTDPEATSPQGIYRIRVE